MRNNGARTPTVKVNPRRSWWKNALGISATAKGRSHSRQTYRPQVEVLEDRTAPAIMKPNLVIAHNSFGSLGSGSTPQQSGGFIPQQVQHAYGFDLITFSGGIQGDGTGQTIAIVDAYDQPNIVSDLATFDQTFG